MFAVKSVRLPSLSFKIPSIFNNRSTVNAFGSQPQRIQSNSFHNSVPTSITKRTTILGDSSQQNWRFYRNYSSDQKQSQNEDKKEDSFRVNIRREEKYSTRDNLTFIGLLFLIAKGSYDAVMALYNVSAHYENDSDITVPVWNGVESDSSWRKKQEEVIGEDVTQSRLLTKKEGLSFHILPFLMEALSPEDAIPNIPWYSRLKLFDVYSTFWVALPVSGSKSSGKIIARAQTHNGKLKKFQMLINQIQVIGTSQKLMSFQMLRNQLYFHCNLCCTISTVMNSMNTFVLWIRDSAPVRIC